MPWSWKITTTVSLRLKLSASCSRPATAEPRGVAGEDAFFARDAPGHDRRVAVGDLLEMIDQAEVDVLRQKVLADALTEGLRSLSYFATPQIVPPVPTPTTR